MLHGTRRALWGRRAAAPAPTTVPCLPGQVGRGGWIYGTPPNAPFVMNTHSPQARGLMGWWPTLKGRERNGLRNYTSRNNGLGAFQDTRTWINDGEMGVVIDYDGGDSISCPMPTDWLSVINQMSVSAWCKTADLTVDQRVASKSAIGGGDWQFVLWMDTGGVDGYAFGVANVAGTTIAGEAVASATADVWQHAVGTWDGTNARIYVDGVLRDTAIGPRVIRASTEPMWISCFWLDFSFFTGQIGDVRLYNRPLSAAEVWALWNPATRWELYRPVGRWR